MKLIGSLLCKPSDLHCAWGQVPALEHDAAENKAEQVTVCGFATSRPYSMSVFGDIIWGTPSRGERALWQTPIQHA